MTAGDDIQGQAEALRVLMREKLGVGGRDFAASLRKAGRLLPGPVRRQGEVIVAAQAMGRNPKLARRLNRAEIDRACNGVKAHLKAIDVADRRRGRLLGWAAAVAFNLLLIAAAFVLWLWWRGYV